jgi:hypothetical protein
MLAKPISTLPPDGMKSEDGRKDDWESSKNYIHPGFGRASRGRKSQRDSHE